MESKEAVKTEEATSVAPKEKEPRSAGLAHRLYSGTLSYDFMKTRKLWFAITLGAVVISLLVIFVKQLTFGIEFRGGTDFQVPVQVTASTIQDVRTATEKFSVDKLEAQVFSIGDDAVRIQTRPLTTEEITATRADIAKAVGAEPDQVTYNTIGGSWGDKISRDAAIAVGVFVVLVMALIAMYFRDWRMAVAAILALAHDMILTLGVYAIVGFTVSPSTLIGLLTVLGYSLYDTVVVFDKVKENTRELGKGNRTYSWEANLAINQVLVRSLNTTVIGVLPVAAMFLAGVYGNSDPLKDLGLALLVGMIAGTFSSIFIATPLLAWMKERTPAMREHRAKLEHREARAEQKEAASSRRASEPAEESGSAQLSLEQGTVQVSIATLERRPRRTHTTRAQRKGKK